jgi:LemA protein
MLAAIIIIVVVILIAVFVIANYNSFVKYRNWVKESWSQIENQLERRYDLIPNLVNTVKGYAKHEEETLEKVIQARNQLVQGSPQERIDADNQIQGALKSIFALKESYPDLKANTGFLRLQEELTTTENKLAYARKLYNSTVAEYNIKRETFPNNMIAGMFHFEAKEQLNTTEEKREVPEVKF